MSEKYEYEVKVTKSGWFVVMASDLKEAEEIAYEMSDDQLDAKAVWDSVEVEGVE